MAHYAFLDENNIVTEVITGIDETETIEGLDTETWYGNLRNQVCKRTSFFTHGGIHSQNRTAFRKNFAGVGYKYDQERDAFILPKPFESWLLNESTCLWEAPVPLPSDWLTVFYEWNEETLSWIEVGA